MWVWYNSKEMQILKEEQLQDQVMRFCGGGGGGGGGGGRERNLFFESHLVPVMVSVTIHVSYSTG